MKSLAQLLVAQRQPLRAWARARGRLAALPGVVGVGIGFKRTAGSMLDVIAFRVWVREKAPRERLSPGERIPPVLFGVPTDVERVADDYFSLQQTVERMSQREGKKVATMVGGASFMVSKAPISGTLGCFAKLRSDPKITVMLTNCHSIYGPKDDLTKPGRLIGQPDISSTGCCKTGVVGRALRGVREGLVDAGIATLNGKRPFDQRLPGIGPDKNGNNVDLITGVPKPVLDAAPNSGSPPAQVLTNVRVGEKVRKVGRSSNVTTGVVVDIGMSMIKSPSVHFPFQRSYTEQVSIRPESGGEGTDRRISFGVEGDSGAVVVNRFNQVVALLHSARPMPQDPQNQERFFLWGAASQIHHVSDQLGIDVFASGAANRKGIPDTVAIANAIVPGTGIVSRSMTPEDEARGEVLDDVVEHLRQSAAGRLVLRLYDTHHGEVRALLDHDRHAKVAWHRNRGPAFMARLLSHLNGLDQPVPKEIEGVPVADGLRRVVEVFMQRGSQALRADAALHAPAVLEILAESTTIRDALERVRARGRPT